MNDFIRHQSICPYCKNENTWGDTENKGYLLCSCGGRFKPKELNEENIKSFINFRKQTTYIYGQQR